MMQETAALANLFYKILPKNALKIAKSLTISPKCDPEYPLDEFLG